MAGFFQKLIGGAAQPALGVVGGIVKSVFDNKEQKLTHDEVMARLALRPNEMQVELNKIEAQHRSVFVAGWRPFIGWVCGAALALVYIFNPLFQWLAGLLGSEFTGPELPIDALMPLVTALLGLGVLRTAEKIRGRAK